VEAGWGWVAGEEEAAGAAAVAAVTDLVVMAAAASGLAVEELAAAADLGWAGKEMDLEASEAVDSVEVARDLEAAGWGWAALVGSG